MSTEVKATNDNGTVKRRKWKVKEKPPDFITKAELAHNLSMSTRTIDSAIVKGSFPPPHSQPSEGVVVWLRRHYDHYVEHRAWPKEAFHDAGGAS